MIYRDTASRSEYEQLQAENAKLKSELSEEKKYSEDLAADICKMEDVLGFKQDQTDKDGAFVPTIGPWMERVRDLIAKEGELGDLKSELEKALQKKDYFLQDNQRLKAEVERVCDKLANSFTKEQVMPLIKLLQDSLKALCAWGPSPADVFIVNEIQSALAHAKEMGL